MFRQCFWDVRTPLHARRVRSPSWCGDDDTRPGRGHGGVDGAGRAVRDGGTGRPRGGAADVEERPAHAARGARGQPGARRRRVPRLRRRGAGRRRRAVRPPDVLHPPRRRSRLRPPPHRRRWRPGRRPRVHRHAQLPGVVGRLLGRRRRRRGRRSAERVVDRPELDYGLSDSGAKVLVADVERAERIADHRDELPALERTLVVRAGPDGPPPGTSRLRGRSSATVPTGRRRCPPSTSTPRTTPRSSTPRARRDSRRARWARTATSAPTSSASAVRARRGRRRGRAPTPTPTSAPARNVYLLSVPFFHATGCHSVLVANLAAGGKLVLMHKWDAERALELIERERVTTFGGVPGDGVAGARAPGRSSAATCRQREGDRLRRRPGRRPSWCAASRSCSPAARRPTATGSPRRRRSRR